MVTNRGCRSGKPRSHMAGTGKGHDAPSSLKRLIPHRGPTILTCGPWKPIYLETFSTKIKDFWFKIELSDELSDATISTYAEIHPVASSHKVEFELFDPDGLLIQRRTVDSKNSSDASPFHLKSPQLWYPAGNGPQPLYTLKVSVLTTAGVVNCTSSKFLGIRRLELIQRP